MKKAYIKDLSKLDYVELYCWVADKRKFKNQMFLDLYDSTGEIQGIGIKDETNKYLELTKITKESAILVKGNIVKDNIKVKEIIIKDYKILSLATLKLSPSPNEKKFNSLDKKYGRLVIERPTLYMRNKKLRSIYMIKSLYKKEMQDYFFKKDFMQFEAPTLTKQTLYKDSGAIWLNVEHQEITLSRCATFHLEPALIGQERIFTITNSHADEKVRTKRHLVEYLHLKAEICWITLDELIDFAGKMYYQISKKCYEKNKELFHVVVPENIIKEKLEKLNPKNHIHITYDEAVEILRKDYHIDFEYGKSISARDEHILTKHFDEKFVWIKYIPYTVEGFMFKRNKNNSFLTQTCDLIAPNGFGEILGCAEKYENYDELIQSMKEKEKFCDYERYKDYCLLHKFGLPFHGGIGMGIERAIRYLLDVDHVKYVKPFAVVKGNKINH